MSLFGRLKRARTNAPFAAPLLSGMPPPARPRIPVPTKSRTAETSRSRRSWDELDAEGQAAFQRWLAGEHRPGQDAEDQP
jgi:hypothetical protein